MNLRKKVIFGAKWVTFSTVFVTAIGLLKISILTRFLEKSDFGLMALITFVMGFVKLFLDLGLTPAILNRQDINKDEYASLYWLNLGFSVILFLIILAITPMISRFYEENQLLVLLPLMGLSPIITALGLQFRTIEQKKMNFQFISLVEIFSSFISLLFAVYLALNDFGVYSLVYSLLLLQGASSLIYFLNGIRSNGLKIHFSFKEIVPFMKIGVYHTGAQIINYFNKGIDVLIIGKLFGTEILGGYSLAKQLVARPKQILGLIITRVGAPFLSKLQMDINVLRKNFLNLINLVATIIIPGYLILIIFASQIVRILYGPDYESIVVLVRILSVFMIFVSLRNPLTSIVIATGKTNLEFYWFLFTFPIIPMAIFFGSKYGIEAVAISMILSMIFLFFPFWWFVIRKMVPVNFFDFLKAHIPRYQWLNVITSMRK